MKVVIAGELPLAEELTALCLSAGHAVSLYLVESLADAQVSGQFATEVAAAGVLIECHNESRAAKRRLLEHAGAALGGRPGGAGDHTASGASGDHTGLPLQLICAQACSTTEAASWLPRPEAVAGWSALPPLATGDSVEVARGLRTTDETAQRAIEFWRGMGLEATEVADGPGLVRARVLCCLVNEAAGALLESVASAQDIDTAMKLGTNYPRGPLAWGDLIGLDAVLGVMRGLYEEYSEDRYRPSPLLARYVQAGWLGQKTGRGFFEYGD